MRHALLAALLLSMLPACAATAPEPPPAAPAAARERVGPHIPLTCPAATRDEILAYLAQAHGETATGAGLTASGLMFVLVRSESGGWTILVSNAEGAACVVAAGKGWTELRGPEV